MTDISWLAQEAKTIHAIFQSFFYLLVTLFLIIGVITEYFKFPLGDIPSFGQLVGRVFIAALLLHAYPDITNAIADITDAVATRLGDLNQFKLVLTRMGDKLEQLSWSWVSFKDTVILIISFLTFFLLYFSIHVADAFYLYAWTLLFVFSPILIALYVLPVTASATKALFRSLVEIAAWKICWCVIATLLWSAALSNINAEGSNVSFLTAICFNIILAGSLLLTPFVVHALAGGGLATMTRNVGALAIGGLAFTPGSAVSAGKAVGSQTVNAGVASTKFFRNKYQATGNAIFRHKPKQNFVRTVPANRKKQNENQLEFNL
jgi:hypothetical protein